MEPNDMINRLKKLFRKKPKVWNLDEGHVIIPAFVDRGVQYYELKDNWNTFTDRGLQALQVYEEWEMRLQKSDLQDFILAFEKILQNPKEVNITEMVRITDMLKERLQFPVPTSDIIYKMAAIRYFDENESPYRIDEDYNKMKIARWKEASSTVDDFFIYQRHVDMLPLPKLSEDVFLRCLKAVQSVNEFQLTRIREALSPQ